jgi:hypothetical protein
MGEWPILSVVIATYNRLAELQTMLDGLLPQVHGQPVEVVVVDDRSTDATWEWLQTTFASSSETIPLRMEKNSGPGPARNAGLAAARGRYFVPIDSDFFVMDGAIERILRAVREEPRRPLLFFPCLQYPAMRRLDKLSGRREIGYSSFMSEQIGELIPVVDLEYIRARGLAYPNLRAGGESLLWASILANGPALFLDSPIILYRTDVAQRICTLKYQMEHPGDLADVADAMATLFSGNSQLVIRQAAATKYLAAGTYHLLAGNMGAGRRRLVSAAAKGCWPAVPTLAASLGGRRCFRALFRFYRTKLKRAYL